MRKTLLKLRSLLLQRARGGVPWERSQQIDQSADPITGCFEDYFPTAVSFLFVVDRVVVAVVADFEFGIWLSIYCEKNFAGQGHCLKLLGGVRHSDLERL